MTLTYCNRPASLRGGSTQPIITSFTPPPVNDRGTHATSFDPHGAARKINAQPTPTSVLDTSPIAIRRAVQALTDAAEAHTFPAAEVWDLIAVRFHERTPTQQCDLLAAAIAVALPSQPPIDDPAWTTTLTKFGELFMTVIDATSEFVAVSCLVMLFAEHRPINLLPPLDMEQAERRLLRRWQSLPLAQWPPSAPTYMKRIALGATIIEALRKHPHCSADLIGLAIVEGPAFRSDHDFGLEVAQALFEDFSPRVQAEIIRHAFGSYTRFHIACDRQQFEISEHPLPQVILLSPRFHGFLAAHFDMLEPTWQKCFIDWTFHWTEDPELAFCDPVVICKFFDGHWSRWAREEQVRMIAFAWEMATRQDEFLTFDQQQAARDYATTWGARLAKPERRLRIA